MDAYSGYNQICMSPIDALKTAFMTSRSNYYYEVMPFGFKNTDATYQCLMDIVFSYKIGRNLEVYVDCMVIKTPEGLDHMANMEGSFE